MSNNAAPFPQLRAGYLRAIARAWRDPVYMQELFRLSATPEGVLPLLQQEFGFTFTFKVKLEDRPAAPDQPRYEPIGTTGWFGFADEFNVPLPKQPAPADELAALALYCQMFPSLLGVPTDGVSEAPPDFAAFGVVTARVLALAWRDPKFRATLLASEDARELVQGAMNYVVEWNFRLKFREVNVVASPKIADWVVPAGVNKIGIVDQSDMRSIITLYFPICPLPESVQACALGAYNATGSQYPFTCG